LNNVSAQINALVTNEHRWASNQFFDLMLAFATEGTVQRFIRGGGFAHRSFLLLATALIDHFID
jgi:hypothetical protein